MRVGNGQRGCAIISLHFCLAEREGSNSCGITALHCWRRPCNFALVFLFWHVSTDGGEEGGRKA